MYFILSKVLLLFIFPLTWVIVLFAAGFIAKKAKLKKRLLYTAFILLLIFTNPYLFYLFSNNWDIQPQKNADTRRYSAGILLGGFAGEDADGNGHFNWASDRFIQAVKLKNTGTIGAILMSGGNGSLLPSNFHEADWVKGELQIFKVPDTCILIENKSRNTIENAQYSKQLLISKRLKPPYLLITSAFHMRRSLYTFKKAGLEVVPYVSNYSGKQGFSVDAIIPGADVLGGWNLYIKELVGMITVSLKKIPAR